ncbi:MAG: aconitase X catalytic domain-containing protein [Desulfurococcaceae archaeon]
MVYLTREQELMLSGEKGFIVAKMMELIVKMCEAYGCEKLVRVNHVHVSGVSYVNIGDYGLEFIKDIHSYRPRASVYTTTNPVCVDLTGLSRILSNEFIDKQLVINKYFEEMGFQPTYSCIPYYFRKPSVNEHLAWGESSAVIYANSVFGARTNREGAPLTIASSITGYTYFAGMHMDENRVVKISLNVDGDVEPELYGALGYWIGENIHETPIIKGIVENYSSIKIMLASAAATGDFALIVIDKITPKGSYRVSDYLEKISVGFKDIEEIVFRGKEEGYVLGYIGCPHLDPLEFRTLVEKFSNRRVKRECGFLVSIPYPFLSIFRSEIDFLRKRGVDVVAGTCPIVSKLTVKPDLVLTNSGKAFFYFKNIHGLNVRIASFETIIDNVTEK